MHTRLFLMIIFSPFFFPFVTCPHAIHIFGDSHALHCFANEQLRGTYIYSYNDTLHIPIDIHWLGPKTMHSFGRDGFGALDIRHPRELDIVNGNVITKVGKGVQEGDILVFTLGEIDVRNHIGKQRDSHHRQLHEIIDTLVEKYAATINLNRSLYSVLPCIVIMEVVPPLDERECIEKTETYGTLQDRVSITHLLNKQLEKMCTQQGYHFLHTHDLYALSDGAMDPLLSDRVVHVAFEHNYLVRQRLIKMLIELGYIKE